MYAPPLGFVVPFLFLLTIAAAPTPPGTHPLAAVGQTLVVSGSGRRERALALAARYAALGEEGAPPLETVEGLHGGELELLSEDAEQRWIVYKTSPRAARASGIGSVQLWDWREGRIGGGRHGHGDGGPHHGLHAQPHSCGTESPCPRQVKYPPRLSVRERTLPLPQSAKSGCSGLAPCSELDVLWRALNRLTHRGGEGGHYTCGSVRAMPHLPYPISRQVRHSGTQSLRPIFPGGRLWCSRTT